jgi:hypothetical protein
MESTEKPVPKWNMSDFDKPIISSGGAWPFARSLHRSQKKAVLSHLGPIRYGLLET